jgi:hypothetical protein
MKDEGVSDYFKEKIQMLAQEMLRPGSTERLL